MKRNWYKYLFIIITFFVIGFIWWNSSKNGEESSGISQGVLYEIMQIFARIGISTDITEHIISSFYRVYCFGNFVKYRYGTVFKEYETVCLDSFVYRAFSSFNR